MEIHTGTIKDLKKKISAAAKKGNMLIPDINTGFAERASESPDTWPLLLLKQEEKYIIIDVNPQKAEVIGLQQSISLRQIKKDGLAFIKGILDRFNDYAVLERNMLAVLSFCQKNKLDMGTLSIAS